MGHEKALHEFGGIQAPVMVGAHLTGELAGTQPGQQNREGLSQLGALSRNLGTDHDKKHDDQYKQEGIDDGDSAAPSLQQPFQMVDQGAHQIGKKDREEESDEGLAGDIK